MEKLKSKIAVVFAASGAVARSFAQHGAKEYVTGRNLTAVKALDGKIKAGGQAEAVKVDALNETETYLQKVFSENGKLVLYSMSIRFK
jgi:3-oxoacyl-[acyl-carrier protein] reductase